MADKFVDDGFEHWTFETPAPPPDPEVQLLALLEVAARTEPGEERVAALRRLLGETETS